MVWSWAKLTPSEIATVRVTSSPSLIESGWKDTVNVAVSSSSMVTVADAAVPTV